VIKDRQRNDGEGRSVETYDPDNKDDIFSIFSQRISDLRFQYSSLLSKNKKKFQPPPDCPICFEAFGLDEEVIRLECKHVYHERCILDWFRGHQTCPMCRDRNRYAIPVPSSAVELTSLNTN